MVEKLSLEGFLNCSNSNLIHHYLCYLICPWVVPASQHNGFKNREMIQNIHIVALIFMALISIFKDGIANSLLNTRFVKL